MGNKKIIAAGAALTAVIAVAGLSGIVYANGGKFNQGQNFDSTKHEAAQTAINNNDYNAWKEAMGDNPITAKINADNFAKFAEAEKLRLAGKSNEARVVMDELGIRGQKGGCGMTDGKKCMNDENHTAIQAALDNNDYNAWKTAMGDKPMADKVTAENFTKYVEAHKLMQAGDKTGAEAIFKELGISGPKGMMGEGRKGMKFLDNNSDGVCDHLDQKD